MALASIILAILPPSVKKGLRENPAAEILFWIRDESTEAIASPSGVQKGGNLKLTSYGAADLETLRSFHEAPPLVEGRALWGWLIDGVVVTRPPERAVNVETNTNKIPGCKGQLETRGIAVGNRPEPHIPFRPGGKDFDRRLEWK